MIYFPRREAGRGPRCCGDLGDVVIKWDTDRGGTVVQ